MAGDDFSDRHRKSTCVLSATIEPGQTDDEVDCGAAVGGPKGWPPDTTRSGDARRLTQCRTHQSRTSQRRLRDGHFTTDADVDGGGSNRHHLHRPRADRAESSAAHRTYTHQHQWRDTCWS